MRSLGSSSASLSVTMLTIAALGYVYGDIGTSVEYTINEGFFGHIRVERDVGAILGFHAMVIWLSLGLITAKYIVVLPFLMYHGEGGVFALLGFLSDKLGRRALAVMSALLILGAGLLIGDGSITADMSFLGAVEGLVVQYPWFEPLVVPTVFVLLTLIFAIQSKGTGKIGMMFGPLMIILWFIPLAGLGGYYIVLNPKILVVLSPLHGLAYMVTLMLRIGFLPTLSILGAAFLAATGGEAMYHDLGHFGRKAIQCGWLFVALPALLLNYLGQGAYLLSGAEVQKGNVFFSMAPSWGLLPMILFSVMASFIASQALLGGTGSLVSQAMALGLSFRYRIKHTNEYHEGQIYLPVVNWALYAIAVMMLFSFRSVNSLAPAYGLAVSLLMLITSIAAMPAAVSAFNWSWLKAGAVFGSFAAIETLFLAANSLKFFHGGYIPVGIAVGMFILMTNWRWGRSRIAIAYRSYAMTKTMYWLVNLKERLRDAGGILNDGRRLVETARTTIVMISLSAIDLNAGVPPLLRARLKRSGAMPRYLILLNIEQTKSARISKEQRYDIKHLGGDLWVVHAMFGFMEQPNMQVILDDLNKMQMVPDDLFRASVEVGEEELIIDTQQGIKHTYSRGCAKLLWYIATYPLWPHRAKAAVAILMRRVWLWGEQIVFDVWARLFRLQLKLATPAHRYFGLGGSDIASNKLGKVVIPVRLRPSTAEIVIPDVD